MAQRHFLGSVSEPSLRLPRHVGSQGIAEKLTADLKGKVRLEDAGFDWKVLGPDMPKENDIKYVAWQADQDAYAFSGQKCSAQSMLLAHESWEAKGIFEMLKEKAAKRSLKDLTISPVLSWTTEKIQAHVDACMALPGAKLAIGGKPLTDHSIPDIYGAFEPTAVFIPLDTMLASQENFDLATTELFGPFQVFTTWKDGEMDKVLKLLNKMPNHLTAGIVSNDQQFLEEMLGNTITGTIYAGIRARTTAAPQQHWFGPSGDPRAAGIHTAEAIKLCWSTHREIIMDRQPVPDDWEGKMS